MDPRLETLFSRHFSQTASSRISLHAGGASFLLFSEMYSLCFHFWKIFLLNRQFLVDVFFFLFSVLYLLIILFLILWICSHASSSMVSEEKSDFNHIFVLSFVSTYSITKIFTSSLTWSYLSIEILHNNNSCMCFPCFDWLSL